jgi:hypothetical protein
MAEQCWTPLEVMQAHLQDLMSQGSMMAGDLATCCVPEDPASPVIAGGYKVACVSFYERGSSVPSH